MKIQVTFKEILTKGYWEEFCDDKGYNPWMLNEGLPDENEKVMLSKEEAIKYGFLKGE